MYLESFIEVEDSARAVAPADRPRKRSKKKEGGKKKLSMLVLGSLSLSVKNSLLTFVDMNSVRKDRPNLVYADIKAYMEDVHSIKVCRRARFVFFFFLLFVC